MIDDPNTLIEIGKLVREHKASKEKYHTLPENDDIRNERIRVYNLSVWLDRVVN